MTKREKQALLESLTHISAATNYVLNEQAERIAFTKETEGGVVAGVEVPFSVIDRLAAEKWIDMTTVDGQAVISLTEAGKKEVSKFRNSNPYFRPLNVYV